MTLIIIVSLLWKPYVPPALVFLFSYQWLQIFGAVFYSDYLGIPIDELFNGVDSEVLFLATLTQVIIMVIYLSRIFKLNYTPDEETLRTSINQLNTKQLLTGYLISFIIFPLIMTFTRSNASLNQLIIAFSVIKKVFLMMLIYTLFLKRTQYRGIIILILIVEFIMGFLSYFSSFKEVIFCIVVGYLTVNPVIKTRMVLRLLPLMSIVFVLMIFWSSVKGDYRDFLNNGSRKQEVTVSRTDALNFLLDRAENYDIDSFGYGGEILLHRAQYMEQYTLVYARVPSVIPYANGDNIIGTLNFIFIPRFLNPSKGLLDASTKTSYYTGKSYANAEQGTAIPMGYFCDLYIDFGLVIMIIPLLIITFITGRAATYILNNNKYNLIFIYSLFSAVFLSLGTFESDIIIYLGQIRNYIVFMILGNVIVFRRINKFITSN
ncbi:MAG: hypothetical protein JST82_17135 [Bacteroidetes bacterium]|nr:hypothetical protein [Bacteroidota bacterium]